jgi:hypothetical protein
MELTGLLVSPSVSEAHKICEWRRTPSSFSAAGFLGAALGRASQSTTGLAGRQSLIIGSLHSMTGEGGDDAEVRLERTCIMLEPALAVELLEG